jgi:hypothetical protein
VVFHSCFAYRGLKSVGVDLSDKEFEYLLSAVDQDNTGVVNYSKFAQYVRPDSRSSQVFTFGVWVLKQDVFPA